MSAATKDGTQVREDATEEADGSGMPSRTNKVAQVGNYLFQDVQQMLRNRPILDRDGVIRAPAH